LACKERMSGKAPPFRDGDAYTVEPWESRSAPAVGFRDLMQSSASQAITAWAMLLEPVEVPALSHGRVGPWPVRSWEDLELPASVGLRAHRLGQGSSPPRSPRGRSRS